jgi:hypothetical protein
MLLLSTLSSLEVANTIAAVELDTNLVIEVGFALVKTASLDDDLALHYVKAGVQAGAAITAEEVMIDLS